MGIVGILASDWLEGVRKGGPVCYEATPSSTQGPHPGAKPRFYSSGRERERRGEKRRERRSLALRKFATLCDRERERSRIEQQPAFLFSPWDRKKEPLTGRSGWWLFTCLYLC